MARPPWYLKVRGWEERERRVYLLVHCPRWALPLWVLDGARVRLKRWWRGRR